MEPFFLLAEAEGEVVLSGCEGEDAMKEEEKVHRSLFP